MRAPFVDPGAMRSELSLQVQAETSDGMGGLHGAWTQIATVHARIEPLTQQSRFLADQTDAVLTHRIVMRFRADVASGMRLVKQARVFDILTVHDPDESGRYLVCRVREAGP